MHAASILAAVALLLVTASAASAVFGWATPQARRTWLLIAAIFLAVASWTYFGG